MKKYIQISAGRGPVECARAVMLVGKELVKDISDLEIVDAEKHNTEPGCFMSITYGSKNDIDPVKIKEWNGTVLWRSTKNPFRPGHKRANWFVDVHFIDPVEIPIIDEKDIVYETCRSGGKGGQNVNKVETTVRAVHVLSGVSVKCSEERSQTQNKARARKRLLLKLAHIGEGLVSAQRNSNWSRHDSLERGNPVKRFFGPL